MPLPSQLPSGTLLDPVHMASAAPQLVPTAALAQLPVPSQVPLLPQGALLLPTQPPCGSAAPAETFAQVPALPVTLQAWQVPQLALVQQTPSTQLLLSHSPALAQAWPGRLRPHVPSVQNLPGAQSEFPAHTVTQAVPAALQASGEQDWVPAGLQVPLPSQLRASVAVTVPVGHDCGAHWVPAV